METNAVTNSASKKLVFKSGDARSPLSNFHRCRVPYGGLIYPSVEHAFQAQKTEDSEERIRIRMAKSPADARRVGESLKLRIGWEKIRVSVMFELLELKFQDRELAAKLIATGDDELAELNEWNDRFWGTVGETGENWTGRLLQRVRDEVRVRIANEVIVTQEDGKIPAVSQKQIEEAAKAHEAGEQAKYVRSFAMHVLMLQGKLETMINIRNSCKGKGSAVERRMICRRIEGLNKGISRCGQIWIALMTGELKPWVVVDPATNEEVKP